MIVLGFFVPWLSHQTVQNSQTAWRNIYLIRRFYKLRFEIEEFNRQFFTALNPTIKVNLTPLEEGDIAKFSGQFI